jgi:hypothetical protein
MKRAALLAGTFFGIITGGVSGVQIAASTGSLRAGLVGALVAGIASGALFAVAGYLLVNLQAIKSQRDLTQTDLIEGETVLFSKPANLVVRPKDFGLQNFAFDDLLWTVGMKDQEALGGSLHLTNFRLIFKSHRINRLRGKVSVFLPTIKDMRVSSFLLLNKMRVTTGLATIDVVVLDVEEVIARVVEARDAMSASSIEFLKNQVITRPASFSDGLERWTAANTVNNLLSLGKTGEDVAGLIRSPLGALTSIFMKELIDRTVADWWQKKFDVT